MTIPLPAGRAVAAAAARAVESHLALFRSLRAQTAIPAIFIADTQEAAIAAWNPTVDPIARERVGSVAAEKKQ
jgi:hypothetical protein